MLKLKKFKFIFKILLGAVAVYLITQKIDLKKVLGYMSNSNVLLLLLAFMVFFISKAVSAFRLNRFFNSMGLKLSGTLNLRLYFLGMFYNLFVPGLGGDAYKIYWLNQTYKAKTKDLIWASVLDRVSGVFALLALAIFFFVFTSYEFENKHMILLLIPLGMVVYYFITKLFFKKYLPVFWIGSVYSFIVQATQVLCIVLIMKSLQINNMWYDYIFIFLVSCFAYLVPIVGFRELTFIWGAEYFGLDKEISLAISLFFYISLAITSLLGWAFMLFPQLIDERQGSYAER